MSARSGVLENCRGDLQVATNRREVIEDIREFRKANRRDGLKIQDLIEEGHRHQMPSPQRRREVGVRLVE